MRSGMDTDAQPLDQLAAEPSAGKRHQKADWAARPLTSSQIDYARFDTRYLFQLRDMLEKELEEKDRLQLAREDFARACKVEIPREKVNGASWVRFSARRDVSTRELTILHELCNFRDRVAEKLDRPPFKVIADDTLLTIARTLPEKDVDLAGAGLSQKQLAMGLFPLGDYTKDEVRAIDHLGNGDRTHHYRERGRGRRRDGFGWQREITDLRRRAARSDRQSKNRSRKSVAACRPGWGRRSSTSSTRISPRPWSSRRIGRIARCPTRPCATGSGWTASPR